LRLSATRRDVLGLPLVLALVAAALAWAVDGPYAAAALLTLAAYEIALSVDNAVPMAGVAGRLHPRMRQVFLTAGLFVGVVVMRLFVPPVAVSAAGGDPVTETTADMVADPAGYAAALDGVRPELAGFGGVFLWLVFSEYLFNAERKDRPLWIAPLERPFTDLHRPRVVQFAVAAVLAGAVALLSPDPAGVGVAGALGIAGYAAALDGVRPELAGFGGVFLWLVFSEYLFNAERKDRPLWIAPLERPFTDLRRPRVVQFAVAAVLATAVALLSPDPAGVGVAGALGIAGYALVKVGARHVWTHAVAVVVERALAVFLLLEILDDTYSFSDTGTGLPVWERLGIALAGVSIGAVFLVRLTRRLDSGEALQRYRYLPAGAAYVLGLLGILLWTSLATSIPAPVAAWFGAVVIGASLVTSVVSNRRRGLSLRGVELPDVPGQRRRTTRPMSSPDR
jgi:uncharacterized protein